MEESTKRKFSCFNCGRSDTDTQCKYCVTNEDVENKPSEWIPKIIESVNHPNHYQSKSGLEAIDVIEAFCDGLEGVEAFCTGNAIKYLCRWQKKNGIEDLKKAEWYLQRLIRHHEMVESKNKYKKESK